MKVELREVSKNYGSQTVLDRVSFKINPGKILAFLGPNGSGKTTLLRLISILDEPTSGKILFNGIESISESINLSLRRRIGIVFQHNAVLRGTVKDNITYGLKVRGMERESVDIKSDEILETMKLDHMKFELASNLSGGEIQRLSIARILVYNPELILLDEPTTNVDPYNVRIIEDVIKNVIKGRQVSIIMVTHSALQAKRLADDAGLIINGKLIELKNINEFLSNSKDSMVRRFIDGEIIY